MAALLVQGRTLRLQRCRPGIQFGTLGIKLFTPSCQALLRLGPFGLPLLSLKFDGGALSFQLLSLGLNFEIGQLGKRQPLDRGRRGNPICPAAARQDLQFHRPDAQPITGRKGGVGECLVVQQRVRRPAPYDGAAGAAEDQAVQRGHATGTQAERAVGGRADRTLGGFQSHDLAVARVAADLENQIAAGDGEGFGPARFGSRGNHNECAVKKRRAVIALNPLLDLAYARRTVKGRPAAGGAFRAD